MTDLTSQWKKGELPCGWYYIKIADIVFIDFFEGKVWKNKKDEYIDKVLAEVPNYDEWFKIKNLASLTSLLQEKNIECLHRENILKELLKEWAQFETEENPNNFTVMSERMSELANKTKEVLK